MKERRISARNRKVVVDGRWKTGETWVVRRKNVGKKTFGPIATNSDNLERDKEAGGGAQGTQGSSKNCTSR